MENRQSYYLSSRLVAPFVNRLIEYQLLPEPKKGYYLDWPSMKKESDLARAQRFQTRVTAYGAALAQGVTPNIFSEKDLLTKLDDFTGDEANAIIKAAADRVAEQQEEQMLQQQEQAQQMADAGYVDPEDVAAGLTTEQIAQGQQLAPEEEVPPPEEAK